MTYSSIDEMWSSITGLLVHRPVGGSRDGDARELLGCHGILSDPSRCWLANTRRKLSPHYAAAEILWYASGTADVGMIQAYAPSYGRHAEIDDTVHGAYGRRLLMSPPGFDRVKFAIKALQSEPNSRRVVISLWEPDDLLHGSKGALEASGIKTPPVKDVPCTLNWQFLVRDGKLHMEVNMRSQDVWLGMPYDIFWNCTAMRIVANELGLELGQYTHNCASIHLYERNALAARTAVFGVPAGEHVESRPVWVGSTDKWNDLRIAASIESGIRRGEKLDYFGHNLICRTLLDLCRVQQQGGEASITIDPALYGASKR